MSDEVEFYRSIFKQVFRDQRLVAEHDLASMTDEELDCDWKLLEYFGSVVVLNLAYDNARKAQVIKDLEVVGLERDQIEFSTSIGGQEEVSPMIWRKMTRNWANIDTSTLCGQEILDSQHRAEAGCYLSHMRVAQKVRSRFQQAMAELQKATARCDVKEMAAASSQVKKYRSVLILEDDCAFGIVDKDGSAASLEGVGRLFREAMRELPIDWDMFYFMALSREPSVTFSPHLKQLKWAIKNVAYVINHSIYDDLIEHLSRIEREDIHEVNPIDNEIGRLHHTHKCFSIYPSIAYERCGVSRITSKKWERLRQENS